MARRQCSSAPRRATCTADGTRARGGAAAGWCALPRRTAPGSRPALATLHAHARRRCAAPLDLRPKMLRHLCIHALLEVHYARRQGGQRAPGKLAEFGVRAAGDVDFVVAAGKLQKEPLLWQTWEGQRKWRLCKRRGVRQGSKRRGRVVEGSGGNTSRPPKLIQACCYNLLQVAAPAGRAPVRQPAGPCLRLAAVLEDAGGLPHAGRERVCQPVVDLRGKVERRTHSIAFSPIVAGGNCVLQPAGNLQ